MRYRTFIYDTARWAAYRHRPGDIVITTPPKCGTTWMQNVVGMLVLDTTSFDRPVAEISPWLDQLLRPLDEVIADLEAQTHRRFIKTHSPIDGLPWHDDVTYISVLRDPRDAAVSWDHHLHNMDLEKVIEARAAAHGLDDLGELPPIEPPNPDPAERWWSYMSNRADDPTFATGLELVVQHARQAWERRSAPNVVLVHYADLQQDLGGEMRRIAERLGVEVPAERWPELVDAASFSSMRERAPALMPNAGPMWLDAPTFFNRGTSGQWQEVVGDDVDERYWPLVRGLLDDEDLLRWLHRP